MESKGLFGPENGGMCSSKLSVDISGRHGIIRQKIILYGINTASVWKDDSRDEEAPCQRSNSKQGKYLSLDPAENSHKHTPDFWLTQLS
jgi:hypothetical protein